MTPALSSLSIYLEDLSFDSIPSIYKTLLGAEVNSIFENYGISRFHSLPERNSNFDVLSLENFEPIGFRLII